MRYSLKLISAILVICGGGYIGTFLSSVFAMRVKQLRQLNNAITQIGFNIDFLRMNVAESMFGAAGFVKGPVKRIFLCAAEEVATRGISPSAAVEKALCRYGDDLCLTASDKTIIKEFAEKFGVGDAESEMNNIKAVSAKLKVAESEAESEYNQKGKLWRAFGMLGGILLVVILF